jgi:hypothetical protein
MVKFWREQCPPVHRAMAAQIGFKAEKHAEKVNFADPDFQEKQEANAEEFFKMFPQRRGPPPAWAVRNRDVIQQVAQPLRIGESNGRQ